MGEEILLMTGASGFLGKRILRNYLRLEMEIYLLVQEKFVGIMGNFLDGMKHKGELRAQVKLLIGDITVPGLALTQADLHLLTERTTTVMHLAAAYNLIMPRAAGYKINVEGTRNLLDMLERMQKLQRFGYLSTTAISGTHRGRYAESDFDVGQRFKNFYEETKFEAEKLVRERMGHIPTTIFRPTIVVGDSKTGEIEKIDGPYYGFVMVSRKVHVVLQRAPRVKCNIEPADFVTDAIYAIMRNDNAVNKVVHIADPNPLTYDEFFDLAIEHWGTFRPLLRVPASWMYPLFFLPMVPWITGVPRQSFVYTMTPVEYGTEEMERLLEETGITCPPPSEYIDVMIRYFRERFDRSTASKVRW